MAEAVIHHRAGASELAQLWAARYVYIIRSQEDDVPGVPPENLAETDLLRELEHLHTTRHGTFLH
ncbi:MAG: DUF6158 family protein, partial [Pseudonocardiaceae bacterium]